jgi:5'-nucleotidase
MITQTNRQILIFGIACLLAGCFLISCAPKIQTPAPAVRKLTIIGTGDLQGRLEPTLRSIPITRGKDTTEVVGGISRIAALIKQIRQESPDPVIAVSSGDDLMGKYFQQFKGKAIFSLMDRAGYELLALGNHEFDHGPEVLARALDSVNFTVLCSDLKVENTSMEKSCQTYLLRDYQGIRVGFFSLMTGDFPVVTVPGNVKIKDNRIVVARKMVALLKEKGARVIIAVTHIGTVSDREIAAGVQGIDIIFGGHSHNYQHTVERVNNTLIVNGGEKGPALVRLDVSLDENNRVLPASANYKLIRVTPDIDPDPQVKAHLARYRNQLPAAIVVGKTEQEWDLSSTSLRTRESAVADMVTDIIRNQFQVDVVLYNGGAFRGREKYPAGPITNSMLTEIDEFESTVFLLTLQGKYLRQVLEHSATLIGEGGFLQVSGIQFSLDPKAPPQKLQKIDADLYRISQPGSRIRDIRIQSQNGSWQPIDPERSYQIAGNNFLVDMGGDSYFWLKKYGTDIRNTYLTMGAIMINYVRNHKIVNPGRPDGRITIR